MVFKEEKVFVTSGKKKASVLKKTNAVSSIEVMIGRKSQNAKPPHLLSQPYHEVEVCPGKRSIRGKSNHGAILRQPCRFCLKGICTRSVCEYWHLTECQFFKTQTGCKVGDECLFPQYMVEEQPNNKPKKGYYFHKRRESDDKNVVAIVKFVPHLGCVSQDSEALVSQIVKQLWGNQNTIHSVHVTSSKYRGKRGPSLGNRQVKNPHQRSPHAVKFDDPSHEETERRQRCARSKEWNFAKTFTSSKKKTKQHSTRGECVLPAASAKEPEEGEFVVETRASMHVVSKRYFNSAKLETMRMSKNPTTVMTADGEVQTEEEATVYVKE